MLKRITDREKLLALLDEYWPELRDVFISAIQAIRDAVTLKALITRLEKQDIEGAVQLLDIDPDAFSAFELALLEAYNAGGQAAIASLPRLLDPQGHVVNFRWGVRNTAGEAELRRHSADLVTNIVADQKDAIRAALTDGLERGQNPKQTASQVVGVFNRQTGKREGGILGLTGQQERFVASARAELSSGDPEALRNYLQRNRRDRRFDATVRKAIADETPLSDGTVDKIAGRYADKLLALRGEVIARTETMRALSKSRNDGIQQQITAGKFQAQDVTKTWHSLHDNRTRLTHLELDGSTVGFSGQFRSISGAMLSYPGDPSAPASEVINCRCMLTYSIDRIAAFRRANGL